jgi:hypothetical protein
MGVAHYAPEIWPRGAGASLAVNHANEANNATDEMPAKGMVLRTLRLAFFGMGECNCEVDEMIIDPRVTRPWLL